MVFFRKDKFSRDDVSGFKKLVQATLSVDYNEKVM